MIMRTINPRITGIPHPHSKEVFQANTGQKAIYEVQGPRHKKAGIWVTILILRKHPFLNEVKFTAFKTQTDYAEALSRFLPSEPWAAYLLLCFTLYCLVLFLFLGLRYAWSWISHWFMLKHRAASHRLSPSPFSTLTCLNDLKCLSVLYVIISSTQREPHNKQPGPNRSTPPGPQKAATNTSRSMSPSQDYPCSL